MELMPRFHYIDGKMHFGQVSKVPCTNTGPCTEAHPYGPCPYLVGDSYLEYMIVTEDYFLPNTRRWLGSCRWVHLSAGIKCDVLQPGGDKEVWAEGVIVDKEGRVTKLPRMRCGKNCYLICDNWENSYHSDSEYSPHSPAAVLRILEKKDHVRDDFEKNWAADVTFLVKGTDIPGDRKYLAAVSPVFDKMFNGRFVEAKQSEIELKDVEPAIFEDFLLAIWRKQVKPNPVNVVPLLELADRFDVSILRDSCERHLMLCYEIPLIHRLILSQKYSLSNLQDFLTGNITAEYWSKLQSSQIEDLNSSTLSKITTSLAQEVLCARAKTEEKKPQVRQHHHCHQRSSSENSVDHSTEYD
ncbi:BTB/POZ domain-containing protein [Ditylenchus destructor]|uniref:BTB/POZ domain-containing protein n=1 Tax=Ditylenchus destructor TaxID=166010 RepID=A0AAD4MUD5_9BILA|nr:BTB/POZ domain-containing protein [Ditylenchus destructor]